MAHCNQHHIAAHPDQPHPLTDRIHGRRWRPRLSALAAGLLLAGAAWAQTAAPGVEKPIDIPAQALDKALRALARQTGMRVVFSTDLTEGKQAAALKGTLAPQLALERLLAGSGLVLKALPDGGFTIAPQVASGRDELTLPVISVRAPREPASAMNGYTIKATPVATGLGLTLKETPQSVSVITQERIQDQGLTTVADVLRNTNGVSFQAWDRGRTNISVRGFEVNSFQYDGVPVETVNIGAETNNTMIYERVEVVRGAAGLLAGAGNPSAAVNMVRKRANSKVFTGEVQAEIGSWRHRAATVDLTTPLNAEGSVRARVVGHTNQQDAFIDLERTKNTTFYGVVDADLTSKTHLSVGASDQRDKRSGVYWGGLGYFYADGSRTDWDRSKTTATRWNQWDTSIQTVFVNLDHELDNRWVIRSLFSYNKMEEESNLLYVYGTPDRDTGLGLLGDRYHYITKPTQNHAVVSATGPFQAWGRSHELTAGLSYSRFKGGWDYGMPLVEGTPLPSFNNWTGDYAQPDTASMFVGDRYTTVQTGLYSAARLQITDPLKVIVGARVSRWQRDIEAAVFYPEAYTIKRDHVFTPYAGVIFDLTPQWSTYASYTSIFQPQDKRRQSGDFLKPVEGKSYELGLKGDLLDKRLQATAAVFRIEQDNFAVEDGLVAGTTDVAYRETKGVRTQGYEIDVVGALARGWDLSAGWTQFTAKDAQNNPVAEQHPRRQFNLFTRYAPAGALQGLTVGAGLKWQSQPPKRVVNPATGESEAVGQPAYALVDVMARFEISPQTSVQLNIGNVFDKKYYTSGYDWLVYGEPRKLTLSVKHQF